MAMLDITKSRTISPAQTFAQFLKELSVRTQLLIMKFRQLVNNISEAEYEDFKARKNSEVQDYYENLADNHKLQVEKAIERAQMRAPLFSRNVTINESRESRSNESFARQEQTEQTVPQQTAPAVRENVEHINHPSINDLIKTGNFTEEQIASLSAKLSEIYGTEVTCRSVTGTHKGPDGTQIPNKSKFLELTMNGKVVVVNQRLNTMGHQPEGVSVPAAIKAWVNEQADIEGPDIPSEEYIAKLINYNEKQNKDTTVTLFNFPVMITHENNIYEAHGKNGETIAVAEHIEDFLPRITEKFSERLASMDTEYQEYMKERSQTERHTEIEPEKSTNIDRTFDSLVRNAFSEMESAGETSREIVAFNRRITVSKTEEGFRLHRGAMNIENPDLDADGDGMTNLAEFLAGTDPFISTDLLKVESFRIVPGSQRVELKFYTVPGRKYRVLMSETLNDPNWTPVPTTRVDGGELLYENYPGNGHLMTVYTDANITAMYFRVAAN